jgi:hypothetical protein
MRIVVPSFEGGWLGGAHFIVSVTRSVVVLFLVVIRAVLLLRNSSFRRFVCFRRTLCCYWE